MNAVDRVAIVGLGLVGGSLARDLAARGKRVLGYDADATSLDAAVRAGAVHEALDASLSGVSGADVVVIAVPVDLAPGIAAALAPHARNARLVTDVGSTKRGIVAAASGLAIAEVFVGSHPMAGDHRSGWGASRAGLFDNARVYVCPSRTASSAAVHLAQQLWRLVGGSPELLSADEHDRHVAWTSHLPHMISAALARALAGARVARSELGSGGRDVTRLAGGSTSLWTAIASHNRDEIVPALAGIGAELSQLQDALERGDDDRVNAWLSDARGWFEAS